MADVSHRGAGLGVPPTTSSLSLETAARIAADAALDIRLDAVEAAVTALDLRIDALEAAPGGGGGTDTLVISVQDYGAVGDGVTDDTAAIQAALDAAEAARSTTRRCVTVELADRTYLISRATSNWCLRWPTTAATLTSRGIIASVSGVTVTLATVADVALIPVGSWVTFYDDNGTLGAPGTKRVVSNDFDSRVVKARNVALGTLTLSSAPPTGTAAGDHVIFDTGSSGITLRGQGTGSVLKLSSPSTTSDLYMLVADRHASHGVIRDLSFDGSFPVDTPIGSTVEQNHALRLGRGSNGGGCEWFTVENVDFFDVRGDGIQMVGGVDEPVMHTTITNSRFDACHRSGIGVNQSIHDTLVSSCQFRRTNDQDIDFEPSGIVGEITNFRILNCHIDHSHNHGNVAMTLTGVGAGTGNRNARCQVIGNTIIDGVVQGLNIENLDFSHNHLSMRGSDQADPMLKLYRDIKGCKVNNNTFIRGFEVGEDGVLTVEGPVINIAFNDSQTPHNNEVCDNLIEQYSPTSGIMIETCNNTKVRGNTLRYRAATSAGATAGIQVNASSGDISGLDISHNTVEGNVGAGSWVYGIFVGHASNDTDRVSVCFNQVDGCSTGDIHLNGTNFPTPPLVTGNVLTRDLTGTGAALIRTGGQGTRLHLEGTGDPEGVVTAGIGSTFLRTDGGAGTTFYVKESGTGNTGWVAL